MDAAPARDDVAHFLAGICTAEGPEQLTALARGAVRELAPRQLRRLYQEVERAADAPRAEAFLAASPLRVMLARREPPDFENTALSSHARFYATPGVKQSDKLLLVVFAAQGGEAFMVEPRLLLRLPARRFDMLRLRAHDGIDYPHGVPGFGDGFGGTCRAIADLAAGYAGAAAIGSSLGAYTALRAAIAARLQFGIALSGRFSALKWAMRRQGMRSFDPLCACIPGPGPALRAYYSADHARDARHAKMLATMRPDIELRGLPGMQDHNVVPRMITDGSFDELLKEIAQVAVRKG